MLNESAFLLVLGHIDGQIFEFSDDAKFNDL